MEAPDEEVKLALNWALEAGYRHIDTAYAYLNEGAIGDVIQDWLKSGKLKREELFITTKVYLYSTITKLTNMHCKLIII